MEVPLGDNTFILKDSRKLGYAIYGDINGKPLFFLHGWPGCRLHAKPLNEIAKQLSVQIISIDRPGFGLSDYKENRTLLSFSDDLIELAGHLGIEKFPIIGVSGGGPYAAACAYKISDRITKVGIVVGLAPPYLPSMTNNIGFLNKLGWANYHKFPILITLTSILSWLDAKYSPIDFQSRMYSKEDRIKRQRHFGKVIKEGKKETFKKGYKAAAKDLELYTSNWGFDLSKIKVPVYLWYGEADKNVSINMGNYYKKEIPGSVLKIYPNEGHTLQITHAEEILSELVK